MFLPITMNTIHEVEVSSLCVEGSMIRDFGPWKKGEAKTLTFNFDEGTCEEHDDNGRIVHAVYLDIVVRSYQAYKP